MRIDMAILKFPSILTEIKAKQDMVLYQNYCLNNIVFILFSRKGKKNQRGQWQRIYQFISWTDNLVGNSLYSNHLKVRQYLCHI